MDESTYAAQVAVIILGPFGTLAKEQGCPELLTDYGVQMGCQQIMGHKGPVKLRPKYIGTIRARTQCQSIKQSLFVVVIQSVL
jgi:hypothetical protein